MWTCSDVGESLPEKREHGASTAHVGSETRLFRGYLRTVAASASELLVVVGLKEAIKSNHDCLRPAPITAATVLFNRLNAQNEFYLQI